MNRRTIIGAALAVLCLPTITQAQGVTGDVDLSRYPVGPVPPEFLTTWRTGSGAAGDWQVVQDPTASQGKAIEQPTPVRKVRRVSSWARELMSTSPRRNDYRQLRHSTRKTRGL